MVNVSSRNRSHELKLKYEFANAVLYALADHPASVRGARGILLPIDNGRWQDIFGTFFSTEGDSNAIQPLAAYCSYFRHGKHRMGYDKDGRRDFGQGARKKIKNSGLVGMPVDQDPSRNLLPGEDRISTKEAITLARSFWDANRPKGDELLTSRFREYEKRNGDESSLEEIITDPIRREMLIEAFERKKSWARLARKLYGFACMIPECDFELTKDDGELYIEVHHIIAMCHGGSPNDRLNLSVLCPNHHREIHYATTTRRAKLTALLKQEQSRRLANS